jgi:5-(carboxyamino)imidazole ribonucleotide mutase
MASRDSHSRKASSPPPPIVSIIMGSKSDWETMSPARDTLVDLGIDWEMRVVSAHRMPDEMFEYAASAKARGVQVIIAGAGGAAHLPGMTASKTAVPVIGVPVQSKALSGIDSILSIAQMPPGVPVATMAIGGAVNAALFAARILALHDADVAERLDAYIAKMHDAAAASSPE